MHTLFSTSKKNLTDFFKSISAEDIRDCCSSAIFRRGKDYFDSDGVDQATYNKDKSSINAVVSGNENYRVTIALNNGNVSCSCTCPYDDVCKHIVATLLYMVDDNSEVEVADNGNEEEGVENKFNQYLQTLSKEELVALVEKFAPDRFRTEVKNKYADTGSAHALFRKAEKKIRKILENEYLMHDFNEFNNALDSELAKLSGLEKTLQKELESLLFQLMQTIDSAVENGELYDYHDDYGYGPSSFFDNFFAGFVASLDKEQKTTFLRKLDVELDKQSYNTFDGLRNVANSVFTEDELPYLKTTLLSDYKNLSREITVRYYDKVQHLLSYKEKVTLLDILSEHNSKRIIELAALHDNEGELHIAIETIKTWLAENCGSYSYHEDVYFIYLDLLKKSNIELSDISAQIILSCPTHTMLIKVISATGSNDTGRYESLLEKKSPDQLLLFLQKTNRLPEAMALIKRKDIAENLLNDFYRSHKTLFPDDATVWFGKIIDKNLQNTGDRYYEAITEAIRHLMKVNKTKANEYVNHIKINYKRRPNLMAMLREVEK